MQLEFQHSDTEVLISSSDVGLLLDFDGNAQLEISPAEAEEFAAVLIDLAKNAKPKKRKIVEPTNDA